MRDIDRIECDAFGHYPKRALRLGIMGSSETWTARVDGRPEAMFGVVSVSLLGGEGRPWFLGTDEVYRHPREMIRFGPDILARWLDSTPSLSNVVMQSNHRAIRLLLRWGFTVGSEARMIGGHPFVDFEMVR